MIQEEHRANIYDLFKNTVERTKKRLKKEDTLRPFHQALLTNEIIEASRFERSFSTSFGQGAIESISVIAALSGGATDACTQRETECFMDEAKLNAINSHINDLRDNRLGRKPEWYQDLESIETVACQNNSVNIRVISDVWWVKEGQNNYLSIKTVKPNIDQTAEAKRDLLKLKINEPGCAVYYGFYYNPYGNEQSDYNHNPPMKIFNLRQDPVVLIGRNYWDTLGGEGFYDELLQIAKEVGKDTKAIIRDFS